MTNEIELFFHVCPNNYRSAGLMPGVLCASNASISQKTKIQRKVSLRSPTIFLIYETSEGRNVKYKNKRERFKKKLRIIKKKTPGNLKLFAQNISRRYSS